MTGADVTGGRLGTDATIDNRLIINGQTITGVDVEAGDAGDAFIDSINAVSDETGVIAERDASGGIALSAQDGRNIEIQTTGDAAAITGLSDGVTTGTVTLESDASFEIGGVRPQDAGFTAGTVYR